MRARTALEVLRKRSPQITDVRLGDGRVLRVHNVAWGRDRGDDYDHVTTNISPSPSEEHTVDFFFTSEIEALIDPETESVLFETSSR